jgi:nitroreductase
MELAQAIKERKSYRAFKPDAVSLATLRQIIEQALRSPSWANTQPWEFAVATGKPLKEIEEGFVAKGIVDAYSEVPRPFEFPEPFMGRIMALQAKERREMTPEEMKDRMLLNFRHYGAPACIYLLIRKNFYFQSGGINSWSLYDSGSCVQNLMLLATEQGLGTVAQAQAVIYPDIIRKVLGIPEDRLIALGISIGYPDEEAADYAKRTDREPLDEAATFYGFQ